MMKIILYERKTIEGSRKQLNYELCELQSENPVASDEKNGG